MAAVDFSSLSKDQVKDFLDSFDTVLSDCDGVLWRYDEAIEGAVDTINKLQEIGKRVFYVTNNSTKTREEFLAKCEKFGFRATKESIISTAYLAASYLKDQNFDKKVYVVGSTGITQELDNIGIEHLEIGPDPIVCDLDVIVNDESTLDPDVGAVIVGFDVHFNYLKILKASSYVNRPGCLFLVTDTDEGSPRPTKNIIIPGAGSLVSAIETCSGKSAFRIGKPSSYIGDVLIKNYEVDPKRTIIIGDRFKSDILLGTLCGFKTVLVLSGVAQFDEIEVVKNSDKMLVPDYYANSISDILPYLV